MVGFVSAQFDIQHFHVGWFMISFGVTYPIFCHNVGVVGCSCMLRRDILYGRVSSGIFARFFVGFWHVFGQVREAQCFDSYMIDLFCVMCSFWYLV